MIKGDDEGSMSRLPQDSVEANLLADVSQSKPPSIALTCKRIQARVPIGRSYVNVYVYLMFIYDLFRPTKLGC